MEVEAAAPSPDVYVGVFGVTWLGLELLLLSSGSRAVSGRRASMSDTGPAPAAALTTLVASPPLHAWGVVVARPGEGMQRVIIEVCCSPASSIGRSAPAGCKVEADDFRTKGRRTVLRILKRYVHLPILF